MKTATKAIIFDMDGMIVHGDRFSERLDRKFGISLKTTSPFFKGPFQQCLVGKADLKKELAKYLPQWNWQTSLNDLIGFWFSPAYNLIHEEFYVATAALRNKGIKCYLATNNEKYRTKDLVVGRGIGSWFDGVFSSAELGCKKPKEEFFLEIIKRIGLPKEKIGFWDDDHENIDGAKAAGLDAKLYTDFDDFSEKIKPLIY